MNTATDAVAPDQAPATEAQTLAQKYPDLSATFLRGNFPGQLKSAHKDLDEKPAKAAQFVEALKAGDIAVPADFSRVEAKKLADLGLNVNPDNIRSDAPRGRRATEGEAAAEAPAAETATA